MAVPFRSDIARRLSEAKEGWISFLFRFPSHNFEPIHCYLDDFFFFFIFFIRFHVWQDKRRLCRGKSLSNEQVVASANVRGPCAPASINLMSLFLDEAPYGVRYRAVSSGSIYTRVEEKTEQKGEGSTAVEIHASTMRRVGNVEKKKPSGPPPSRH